MKFETPKMELLVELLDDIRLLDQSNEGDGEYGEFGDLV